VKNLASQAEEESVHRIFHSWKYSQGNQKKKRYRETIIDLTEQLK